MGAICKAGPLEISSFTHPFNSIAEASKAIAPLIDPEDLRRLARSTSKAMGKNIMIAAEIAEGLKKKKLNPE
jgi:hypothetical protein